MSIPVDDRYATASAEAMDDAPATPEALTPPPGLPRELVFEAQDQVTFRCGKASITLYANGKIALRGEYIVSDAEGVNRIAGGQIELN